MFSRYLCPNIINFDSVDFSERRPEEVKKFLLTLSVLQSCSDNFSSVTYMYIHPIQI